MKKTILLASLMGAAAYGEAVCGRTYETAERVKVQVICLPIAAMRAMGLPIPPTVEAVTQVYVDVPEGAIGAASVLEGEAKIDFARTQNDGGRRAILVFERAPGETLPTVEIVYGSTGATTQARRK